MGVMSTVELVGIVNVTPDSFSDGGLYVDVDEALKHADELFRDGATLVDVGAESTRPNAIPLTADQEWQRLADLWPRLMERYEGKLSLDTRHPETVRRAAQYGSFIINDVTAFSDNEMIKVAAERGLQCIVSHLPSAVSGDIQAAHKGKLVDNVEQVRDELLARRDEMIAHGIAKQKIILDPGIGFGKTPETNRELLKFAALVPDAEVMIGYSRKRFLGDDRMELEPNLAAGRIAASAGARYLRVHDVAGHRQAKI